MNSPKDVDFSTHLNHQKISRYNINFFNLTKYPFYIYGKVLRIIMKLKLTHVQSDFSQGNK